MKIVQVFPIEGRQTTDAKQKSFASSLKPLINWSKFIAIDLGSFESFDGHIFKFSRSKNPNYRKKQMKLLIVF